MNSNPNQQAAREAEYVHAQRVTDFHGQCLAFVRACSNAPDVNRTPGYLTHASRGLMSRAAILFPDAQERRDFLSARMNPQLAALRAALLDQATSIDVMLRAIESLTGEETQP